MSTVEVEVRHLIKIKIHDTRRDGKPSTNPLTIHVDGECKLECPSERFHYAHPIPPHTLNIFDNTAAPPHAGPRKQDDNQRPVKESARLGA